MRYEFKCPECGMPYTQRVIACPICGWKKPPLDGTWAGSSRACTQLIKALRDTMPK